MQTDTLSKQAISKVLQTSMSLEAAFRLSGSIVLGALVTFCLFAVMNKLISQPPTQIVEQPPFVSIDSVFKLDESPEIQRNRPMPPPEIVKQPTTPQDIKATPNSTDTFSRYEPPTIVVNDKVGLATIKMADRGVTPIFRVNPRYPTSQAQSGVEGFVSLRFDVSASGNVINIEVIDAEPKRVFDRAARQALRKWRYQPKIESGKPVAMQGLKVRLDFKLDQ